MFHRKRNLYLYFNKHLNLKKNGFFRKILYFRNIILIGIIDIWDLLHEEDVMDTDTVLGVEEKEIDYDEDPDYFENEHENYFDEMEKTFSNPYELSFDSNLIGTDSNKYEILKHNFSEEYKYSSEDFPYLNSSYVGENKSCLNGISEESGMCEGWELETESQREEILFLDYLMCISFFFFGVLSMYSPVSSFLVGLMLLGYLFHQIFKSKLLTILLVLGNVNYYFVDEFHKYSWVISKTRKRVKIQDPYMEDMMKYSKTLQKQLKEQEPISFNVPPEIVEILNEHIFTVRSGFFFFLFIFIYLRIYYRFGEDSIGPGGENYDTGDRDINDFSTHYLAYIDQTGMNDPKLESNFEDDDYTVQFSPHDTLYSEELWNLKIPLEPNEFKREPKKKMVKLKEEQNRDPAFTILNKTFKRIMADEDDKTLRYIWTSDDERRLVQDNDIFKIWTFSKVEEERLHIIQEGVLYYEVGNFDFVSNEVNVLSNDEQSISNTWLPMIEWIYPCGMDETSDLKPHPRILVPEEVELLKNEQITHLNWLYNYDSIKIKRLEQLKYDIYLNIEQCNRIKRIEVKPYLLDKTKTFSLSNYRSVMKYINYTSEAFEALADRYDVDTLSGTEFEMWKNDIIESSYQALANRTKNIKKQIKKVLPLFKLTKLYNKLNIGYLFIYFFEFVFKYLLPVMPFKRYLYKKSLKFLVWLKQFYMYTFDFYLSILFILKISLTLVVIKSLSWCLLLIKKFYYCVIIIEIRLVILIILQIIFMIISFLLKLIGLVAQFHAHIVHFFWAETHEEVDVIDPMFLDDVYTFNWYYIYEIMYEKEINNIQEYPIRPEWMQVPNFLVFLKESISIFNWSILSVGPLKFPSIDIKEIDVDFDNLFHKTGEIEIHGTTEDESSFIYEFYKRYGIIRHKTKQPLIWLQRRIMYVFLFLNRMRLRFNVFKNSN